MKKYIIILLAALAIHANAAVPVGTVKTLYAEGGHDHDPVFNEDTYWWNVAVLTSPSGIEYANPTLDARYGNLANLQYAPLGRFDESMDVTLDESGTWTLTKFVGWTASAAGGGDTTYESIEVEAGGPVETWTPFSEIIQDWYDVSSWSPDPATIPEGTQFTQSKNQQQDWRSGERSSLGNERNVTLFSSFRTVTQDAVGTKEKIIPVLTWAPPAAIVFGQRLSAVQLNATANTNGTFTYSPAENTTLNAGADQVLEVTFTPDDADNFTQATASTSITVNRAPTALTITSPTSSPVTLPVGSSASISTRLKRIHDNVALSTTSVSLAVSAASTGASGDLAGNQFTMNSGDGNDTVTITATFAGDGNHEPSSDSVTFRIPTPGTVISPLVSPVKTPDAFLFASNGPTSSTFDFVLTNPGELLASIESINITPALGDVPSFTVTDSANNPLAYPLTVPPSGSLALKITFTPRRYATNSDTLKIAWQCRPNSTVLASGEVVWTLEGQGLKPIIATLPRGTPGDPGNPRDATGQWPALRAN